MALTSVISLSFDFPPDRPADRLSKVGAAESITSEVKDLKFVRTKTSGPQRHVPIRASSPNRATEAGIPKISSLGFHGNKNAVAALPLRADIEEELMKIAIALATVAAIGFAVVPAANAEDARIGVGVGPVGAGVTVGESHDRDRDRDRTTVIKRESEPREHTTIIKKEREEPSSRVIVH